MFKNSLHSLVKLAIDSYKRMELSRPLNSVGVRIPLVDWEINACKQQLHYLNEILLLPENAPPLTEDVIADKIHQQFKVVQKEKLGKPPEAAVEVKDVPENIHHKIESSFYLLILCAKVHQGADIKTAKVELDKLTNVHDNEPQFASDFKSLILEAKKFLDERLEAQQQLEKDKLAGEHAAEIVRQKVVFENEMAAQAPLVAHRDTQIAKLIAAAKEAQAKEAQLARSLQEMTQARDKLVLQQRQDESEHKHQLTKLNEKVKLMEAEVTPLRPLPKLVEELRATIQQLEVKLKNQTAASAGVDGLRSKVASQSTELATKSGQISQLQGQLRESKNELETKLKSLRDSKSELEGKVKELKAELAHMEKDRDARVEEVKAHLNTIRELEKTLKKVKTELSNARSESRDDEEYEEKEAEEETASPSTSSNRYGQFNNGGGRRSQRAAEQNSGQQRAQRR